MKLRIKFLRENEKMTQKELAQKLGSSVSNISKYELGQIEPNIDTLVAMSSLFGVSVDYLLGLSNNPTAAKSALNESDADLDYVYITGTDGKRHRYYIPPEKKLRFQKLMEGGMPELFE